jgi:hypothetical protein
MLEARVRIEHKDRRAGRAEVGTDPALCRHSKRTAPDWDLVFEYAKWGKLPLEVDVPHCKRKDSQTHKICATI